MPGHEMPLPNNPHAMIQAFMSSSLQVSPGIPVNSKRPANGKPLNKSQTWFIIFFCVYNL